MSTLNLNAVDSALNLLKDGGVFERFAQSLLSAVIGYEFVPAGGIHDRGIDGLEHTFEPTTFKLNVYQASVEADPEAKLRKTLKVLRDNKIDYSQLTFVTSQPVKNPEKLVDELFTEFNRPVRVWARSWILANVNQNEATARAYLTHIASHLHEYQKPGYAYEVIDQVSDPRLLVFLRQQWEGKSSTATYEQTLLDALILYALKDTDPDLKVFLTGKEVRSKIGAIAKFGVEKFEVEIAERLKKLSSKPRRIHEHPEGYCLPFETRTQIQERNLLDYGLHKAFLSGAETRLRATLKDKGVQVKDCVSLVERTVNQLFHQQGLEFADFVLYGQNPKAFEKSLSELVARVVSDSAVIPKNRPDVQQSLLMAIREVVYSGSKEEKEFLRRLAQTYMMLFMLQCDPKVAAYFESLASKMTVFVCTSIIIPALSEYYLEPQNRRHWNLLKAAHERGVRLVVNKIILRELMAHFNMVKTKYEQEYRDKEEYYLTDDSTALYVEEILLRSYFYSRLRKETSSFNDYLDAFINSSFLSLETDLVEFLKSEFGIEYVEGDSDWGVSVSSEDVDLLAENLGKLKSHAEKARNDAKVVLTVYAIREKNNELGTSGVFGYHTWWLSKDRSTWQATTETFGKKYTVSCYIRPDFLYSYIALAPTRAQVDDTYRDLFPSLVGVNISFHLPAEVTSVVHRMINEFHIKKPCRICSMLRELTDRLKYDPNARVRSYVVDFFEAEKKKLLANP